MELHNLLDIERKSAVTGPNRWVLENRAAGFKRALIAL